MRKLASAALYLTIALALAASGPALAKRKGTSKSGGGWAQYSAALACDTATTRVVLHNPASGDVAVRLSVSSAAGITTTDDVLSPLEVLEVSCASTGLVGIGSLLVESASALAVTAIYETSGGVDVETLGGSFFRGKYDFDSDGDSDGDSDDSDDSDSDDSDSDTD